MSDACIVCETEAIDTSDWYYCRKTTEYVCPWCVKDMHNSCLCKNGKVSIECSKHRHILYIGDASKAKTKLIPLGAKEYDDI